MVSVRRVAPVLLLVIATPAVRRSEKSSSHPPRDLHRVGDHWTAYNPPDPATYPAGAKTYTIKRATRSGALAQQFYKQRLPLAAAVGVEHLDHRRALDLSRRRAARSTVKARAAMRRERRHGGQHIRTRRRRDRHGRGSATAGIGSRTRRRRRDE